MISRPISRYSNGYHSIPIHATRLLAFFGADHQPDRAGAEAFEKLVGAVAIGFRGIDDHNLMYGILKRRVLATFFERYLTGDLDEVVPPPGERLLEFSSLAPPAPGASGQPATVDTG